MADEEAIATGIEFLLPLLSDDLQRRILMLLDTESDTEKVLEMLLSE